MRLAEASTAGQLRHFGPPVASGSPGNFPGVPDETFVALCLVPAEQGLYAVYGVPDAGVAPLRLWTQNLADQFSLPA